MTLRMLTEQNREQAIYKIVNHPIPQYGRGLFTKPLATKTTQDFIDGANAAESLDGNQVALIANDAPRYVQRRKKSD